MRSCSALGREACVRAWCTWAAAQLRAWGVQVPPVCTRGRISGRCRRRCGLPLLHLVRTARLAWALRNGGGIRVSADWPGQRARVGQRSRSRRVTPRALPAVQACCPCSPWRTLRALAGGAPRRRSSAACSGGAAAQRGRGRRPGRTRRPARRSCWSARLTPTWPTTSPPCRRAPAWLQQRHRRGRSLCRSCWAPARGRRRRPDLMLFPLLVERSSAVCGVRGLRTTSRAAAAPGSLLRAAGRLATSANDSHEVPRRMPQRSPERTACSSLSRASRRQAISDSTTLPQMVEELAQHLNSASNVDALVLQLRCLPQPYPILVQGGAVRPAGRYC